MKNISNQPPNNISIKNKPILKRVLDSFTHASYVVLKFYYKSLLLTVVRKVNTQFSKNIPKYEISDIHIKNAKLITTREELLRVLPKNGVVAELGVDEGVFSNLILEINKPIKLHLIDLYRIKRKKIKVESKFMKAIENKTVEINLGLSTSLVYGFNDDYFDWIYIDTCHSYKTTIQELELYHTKVKADGIIAGHDYILGNWNEVVRYGVIEAVHEFCVKYHWEIIYLTTVQTQFPSFAIRRIT